MSVIFIDKIRKGDTEAYKDTKTVSSKTIGKQKIYACRRLTSWFRLGDYIIKHDIANYLLGITDDLDYHHRKCVTWSEYDSVSGKFVSHNSLDTIAERVSSLGLNSRKYVELLEQIQKELEGYEECYYRLSCFNIHFDYKEFLNDKQKYVEKSREIWREETKTEAE